MHLIALHVRARFAIIAASLGLIAGYASPALGQREPAAWIPADAIAYAGIPDLAAVFGDADQSGDIEWFSISGVRAAARALGQQVGVRAARALEIKPEEVRNPFAGAAAIALLRQDGGDAVPLAIVGVRDKTLMREYFDKLIANLSRVQPRRESRPAGIDIIEIFGEAAPAEAESAAPQIDSILPLIERTLAGLLSDGELPPRFALCLAGDRLMVSTDPSAIQAALRVSSQTALSEDAEFRAARAPLSGNRAVEVYANVPAAFEWFGRFNARGAAELRTVLGGDCIRSAIAHLSYAAAESSSKLELRIRLDGERRGLARIGASPNRKDALAASECAAYVWLAVDPAAALDSWQNALRSIDGELADQMNEDLRALRVGPEFSIDLRSELVAFLGTPLAAQLRFTEPLGSGSTRAAFRLAHSNAAALRRLLNRGRASLGMASPDESSISFGDVSITVADQELQIGHAAEFAASNQTSPAASGQTDAALARALALAPPERWGVFYLHGPRLARAAGELTRRDAEIRGGVLAHPADILGSQMARSLGGLPGTAVADPARWVAARPITLSVFSTDEDAIRITHITMRENRPQ